MCFTGRAGIRSPEALCRPEIRYSEVMGRQIRQLSMLALSVLCCGCVTTANLCGNEQRDWSNLNFPKASYCSVPAWVPFSKSYEKANRAVCKVHDNNRGIASTMSSAEADYRFLCDYIKRSQYPWGVRHITGYISYGLIRLQPKPAPVNPADAQLKTQHDFTDTFFRVDAEPGS